MTLSPTNPPNSQVSVDEQINTILRTFARRVASIPRGKTYGWDVELAQLQKLLLSERLDEAQRIPNPGWIGNDGIRINPNERYKAARVAELTNQMQELENKEKEI